MAIYLEALAGQRLKVHLAIRLACIDISEVDVDYSCPPSALLLPFHEDVGHPLDVHSFSW